MKLYKVRFVLIGGSDNRCTIRRVRFIEADTKWGHYLYHPVTGEARRTRTRASSSRSASRGSSCRRSSRRRTAVAHSRRDDARAIRIFGTKKTGEELTTSLGGLNGYALSHNEFEMELSDKGRAPLKDLIPPTIEETDVPWDGPSGEVRWPTTSIPRS